jgi:hypothetical protein
MSFLRNGYLSNYSKILTCIAALILSFIPIVYENIVYIILFSIFVYILAICSFKIKIPSKILFIDCVIGIWLSTVHLPIYNYEWYWLIIAGVVFIFASFFDYLKLGRIFNPNVLFKRLIYNIIYGLTTMLVIQVIYFGYLIINLIILFHSGAGIKGD